MAKARRRTAYHHGDLRAALVEAALKAVDREGELPSWRALARTCGVSSSSPYRHFASLEALAAAVATECFRRLLGGVVEALTRMDYDRGPTHVFAEGLRAYIRFGTKHPAWYELMFGGRFSFDAYPEAEQAATQSYAALEAGVAICGVRGAERTKAVAFTAWVALHGLVDLLSRVKVGSRGGTEDNDQLAERVIRMVLAHVEHEARG
jgi:AcrR family transcriptional regulator